MVQSLPLQPVAEAPPYYFFCPRCDRPYKSDKSKDEVVETVREHVAKQHPDHDPDWLGDYPHI